MPPYKLLATWPPEARLPDATSVATQGTGGKIALMGESQSPTTPVLYVEEGTGNQNAVRDLNPRGLRQPAPPTRIDRARGSLQWLFQNTLPLKIQSLGYSGNRGRVNQFPFRYWNRLFCSTVHPRPTVQLQHC